jgi:endonuclease/exonuclease/phosphatase (EEP) superfamily protein YafD
MRGLLMTIAATGFLASAIVVVPEAASGFTTVLPTADENSPIYKVMSRNLFGVNARMDEVAEAIAAEDPDIVVLQEYFPWQARRLEPLIRENYPFRVRCTGGKRANIALLSKIPFEVLLSADCPKIDDPSVRTSRIAVRMKPESGEAFTVVTTHLDWPIPEPRKTAQIADLLPALATLPGPLLIAGDFNATPWSYSFRQFIVDAGLSRHTRNLFTYPVLWHYLGRWRPVFPFLPLDHLMTRGNIAVLDLRTGDAAGSDHLPLISEFTVSGMPLLALRPSIEPDSAN